jgi:hypothetical protein
MEADMSSWYHFYCRLLVLSILLAACSPATSPPVPLPTHTPFHPALERPPLETRAEPVFPPPVFQVGQNHTDSANDMPISFLDVIGFRARVDEAADTVEVVLRMRDIPHTAPLGQVTNLLEYSWAVYVYLDPSTEDPSG